MNMKPQKAEIVFIIDASESMRPCIDSLRKNISQIVEPLQGHDIPTRLGLLGMRVAKGSKGGQVFFVTTLCGGFESVYSGGQSLFTDAPADFTKALGQLELGGDENHLVALDLALDFPFGPVETTRRVICLFSDEKIEDGLIGPDQIEKVPELINKIEARRIQVFGALPASPCLEQFAMSDNCRFEPVSGTADGLRSVNLSKLLGQIGKTVSATSLQGQEGRFKKAVFGQNAWGTDTGSFSGLR